MVDARLCLRGGMGEHRMSTGKRAVGQAAFAQIQTERRAGQKAGSGRAHPLNNTTLSCSASMTSRSMSCAANFTGLPGRAPGGAHEGQGLLNAWPGAGGLGTPHAAMADADRAPSSSAPIFTVLSERVFAPFSAGALRDCVCALLPYCKKNNTLLDDSI